MGLLHADTAAKLTLFICQPAWLKMRDMVCSMQIEEMAKSVLGLYQKAIASADLLPSDKEDLSARACTFADLCGSAAMQEAAERLHAARSAPFLSLFKL